MSLKYEPYAQVISGSVDQSVRAWEVASGRQVGQFAGNEFAFVEGLADPRKRGRHILTVCGAVLLIYEGVKAQQHEGGAAGAAAAPVACFKAPKHITALKCHGSVICVGCIGGAVCILSVPFLAA